jgi:hypothetical protein
VANTRTRADNTHHTAGNTHAAYDAYQQALGILTDLDHPDTEQLHTKLHHLDDSHRAGQTEETPAILNSTSNGPAADR